MNLYDTVLENSQLQERVRSLQAEHLRLLRDLSTMEENLTETQKRCTTLEAENRELKKVPSETPEPLTDKECDRLANAYESGWKSVGWKHRNADESSREALRAVLAAAGRYVSPEPEPAPLTDAEAYRLAKVYERHRRVGPGGSPTAEENAVRALLREAGRYVAPTPEPVPLTDEECDRLATVYIETWREDWSNGEAHEASKRTGIRAVLRAAGRYVEPRSDLGHVYDPTDFEPDLPPRRREVSDEELPDLRSLHGGNGGDLARHVRALMRQAIALATRPVLPPTEEQLRATYDSTQHLLSLRRVWNLEGRSTITREEFDRALPHGYGGKAFEDFLAALGLTVEGT